MDPKVYLNTSNMKKIEDYVWFYVGGKILIPDGLLATNLGLHYKITEEGWNVDGITILLDEFQGERNKLAAIESHEFDLSRLALRPYSTVTQEEAIHIAKEIFFYRFNMDPNGIMAQRYPNDMWLVYYGEVTSNYRVTVTPSGKIGVYNPTTQKFVDYNYTYAYKLTPWLLKQQFDIYGLIEAGLAVNLFDINKPKQPENQPTI